jgi:hypothetical protein
MRLPVPGRSGGPTAMAGSSCRTRRLAGDRIDGWPDGTGSTQELTLSAGVRVCPAPSPNVHCGHPALRSLDAGRAFGILPSLAANAGCRGMGTPSRMHRRRRHYWEHPIVDTISRGSGLPSPSAGRSLRASCPPHHSMPAALSASCLRLPPTPAAGMGNPSRMHQRRKSRRTCSR